MSEKVNEILERGLWTILTPIFPYIQHGLLRLGIISHKGRQPYLLGHLPNMKNFHGFKHHLERQGFGNHFIAWYDTSQILGWRKRIDFKNQYHVRVFKDGEVRGHYELTPESHPAKHFFEVGQEPQRENFLKFFGEWVLPASEADMQADLKAYKARHAKEFNEY